ncbi:hypothetical protein P0L94_00640 [Microbacter sp. GSS18]|nr:hypothetical protein P0L94_00640 [Microbacter sp. GSS18]
MSNVDPATDTGRSAVSRRTVVRGTAWAVPVVMVAAAVPAFAASQLVSVDSAGVGCHVVQNPPDAIRAYIMFTGADGINVSVTGVTAENATPTNLPVSGVIASGQWEAEVHFQTTAAFQYAGRVLTVSYTANSQPQPSAQVVIPAFTARCP